MARTAPTEDLEESGPLAQLFGFVQLEFAGALALGDGRYLAREGGEEGARSVLVVETLGAASPPGRRRRRARQSEPDAEPPPLPLTRVTAVRAHQPFASAEEAAGWLDDVSESEERLDAAVAEGVGLLNRALHAQATASADPYGAELGAERAVAARIGYGSGEEVAAGRFVEARDVDPRAGGASKRSRRAEDLRPQERVAAVLAGRERIDACETLLLRARADLDAGRGREAALQLGAALDALLVELEGALVDPRHENDMRELTTRREEAAETAEAALHGELNPQQLTATGEIVALCERVLRRRRLLRG